MSGTLVRCEQTRVTLYRIDPQGQGLWIWCRGHKQEEFKTWEQLGLTREAAEKLLLTMK